VVVFSVQGLLRRLALRLRLAVYGPGDYVRGKSWDDQSVKTHLCSAMCRERIRGFMLICKTSVCGPGDYVCREGDVGREMYIIGRGRVVVVVVWTEPLMSTDLSSQMTAAV